MDAGRQRKRFVKESVPAIYCSVMRGTRQRSDPRQTVGRAGHV